MEGSTQQLSTTYYLLLTTCHRPPTPDSPTVSAAATLGLGARVEGMPLYEQVDICYSEAIGAPKVAVGAAVGTVVVVAAVIVDRRKSQLVRSRSFAAPRLFW